MTDTEPTTPTESTTVMQPPTAKPAEPAPPNTREALRAELEATRAKYHELRNSLSDSDWNKKSANPAWNVRS